MLVGVKSTSVLQQTNFTLYRTACLLEAKACAVAVDDVLPMTHCTGCHASVMTAQALTMSGLADLSGVVWPLGLCHGQPCMQSCHSLPQCLDMLRAGVYCNSVLGVEAFAADVQAVCDLFRQASKRSNSVFAGELQSKQAAAMADLVSQRMHKLLSQHHGLAVPDQAPTPAKKLKKGGSNETSPGSSTEPGSSQEKSNIVEDLAR